MQGKMTNRTDVEVIHTLGNVKEGKEKIWNKNQSVLSRTDGITLVALVVTIVVLLILAGITIGYVLGDNGIIKMAQNARNIMNEAMENELESLKDISNMLTNNIENNEEVPPNTNQKEKLIVKIVEERGTTEILISYTGCSVEIYKDYECTELWKTIRIEEEQWETTEVPEEGTYFIKFASSPPAGYMVTEEVQTFKIENVKENIWAIKVSVGNILPEYGDYATIYTDGDVGKGKFDATFQLTANYGGRVEARLYRIAECDVNGIQSKYCPPFDIYPLPNSIYDLDREQLINLAQTLRGYCFLDEVASIPNTENDGSVFIWKNLPTGIYLLDATNLEETIKEDPGPVIFMNMDTKCTYTEVTVIPRGLVEPL